MITKGSLVRHKTLSYPKSDFPVLGIIVGAMDMPAGDLVRVFWFQSSRDQTMRGNPAALPPRRPSIPPVVKTANVMLHEEYMRRSQKVDRPMHPLLKEPFDNVVGWEFFEVGNE